MLDRSHEYFEKGLSEKSLKTNEEVVGYLYELLDRVTNNDASC
jgi:hypothetical protein